MYVNGTIQVNNYSNENSAHYSINNSTKTGSSKFSEKLGECVTEVNSAGFNTENVDKIEISSSFKESNNSLSLLNLRNRIVSEIDRDTDPAKISEITQQINQNSYVADAYQTARNILFSMI